MIHFNHNIVYVILGLLLSCSSAIAAEPLVVQAKRVLTAAGKTIENGTIVCVDGKIKAIEIGRAHV